LPDTDISPDTDTSGRTNRIDTRYYRYNETRWPILSITIPKSYGRYTYRDFKPWLQV